QFGSRETRQSRITHQFNQPLGTNTLGYPPALCITALIGPDDAWSQYLVLLIQQNHAMHLTREADTFDVLWPYIMVYSCYKTGTNSGYGSSPPIIRLLLRPARSRMHQWIIDKGCGEYTAIVRGEDGCFDACCA